MEVSFYAADVAISSPWSLEQEVVSGVQNWYFSGLVTNEMLNFFYKNE